MKFIRLCKKPKSLLLFEKIILSYSLMFKIISDTMKTAGDGKLVNGYIDFPFLLLSRYNWERVKLQNVNRKYE